MKDALIWDHDLIARYNTSGPRYTSYPTVVQFSEDFHQQSYLSSALRSTAQARSLSLYVHIPFCTNICYFCACNKIITKHHKQADHYLQALFRDIDMQADLYSPRQEVEQLHFGGGSPTFLNDAQLKAIIDKIASRFQLSRSDESDYSIEIDPRDIDWPRMANLCNLGFNRISLGVQDINEKVQKAVNRIQSEALIQSIVDAARTMAFKSIHMDLIYGLPFQTPDSFSETLDCILAMEPDRLSLFNYAHLPRRFMPQRRIHEADLPSAQEKLEILQQSTETLLQKGYVYIGMDHFALPDDQLAIAQENGALHRNFQGYTTHRHCDLIGLGLSAISHVGSVYSQNYTDENRYQQAVENNELPIWRGLKMSQDDQIRHDVINEMICHFRLNPEVIEKKFSINFSRYFSSELRQLNIMVQDNLLTLSKSNTIKVTDKGRLFIRNICMVFDRYLATPTQQAKPLFSKVI
ncbi:Oxygen-independent coproporphyrinogen III oxidase [invertebrate metagenome]|uniref:coproporphyrinogen dehydrogenase n=1 Tax=invertebrate metagenome TaxID=1711999 RepID=A0A2H9TAE5_9ZZZZ